MTKRYSDRRPDQKPAERDPSKPDAGRRMPEVPENRNEFGKPEGYPIDKRAPKPGPQSGGRDILDSERSDRESGRPLQLEDDDERETIQSGRVDAEPGREDHPQGRPREVKPTQR